MEEVKNEGWGDVSQSYLKWFLHSPTEKKIDGVEFIIREFPALFLLHFLFLLVFCLYVFLKFSEISKSWLRLMVTSIVLHGHQPLRILLCFYFSCVWWAVLYFLSLFLRCGAAMLLLHSTPQLNTPWLFKAEPALNLYDLTMLGPALNWMETN